MAYIASNPKTKKQVKQDLKDGKRLEVYRNTPWGKEGVNNAELSVEGPHYPRPHSWYGVAKVQNGVVVSFK